MESKKDFLIRKAKGKEYFSKYFEEINSLSKFPIEESQIMSLEKTDVIIEKSKNAFLSRPYRKDKFDFSNKDLLKDIIDKTYNKTSSGLFLFIKYSKFCGAVHLKSINDFNLDFQFNDEHTGLISLICENFTEKILFDFYEENQQQFIEIEFFSGQT